MADYPVRDGNGNIIIAAADGPNDTYPIRDKDGKIILAAEYADAGKAQYPVKDGNGNIIISLAQGGGVAPVVPAVISITSGGGYAGSTYHSDKTGGQWYADGVAIIGQTAQNWTMTFAYEGAAITYRIGSADSNVIEMYTYADAGISPAAIMDGRQGLTVAATAVSAWASRVGGLSATQATGSSQPTYQATGFNGAAPQLDFDGGDNLDGLAISSQPTVRTVIIAFVADKVSGGNSFLIASGGVGCMQFGPADGDLRLAGFGGGGGVKARTSGYSFLTGTPYIVSLRWTADGPVSWRINGATYSSGTAANGGFFSGGTTSIGGSLDAYDGKIAAIHIHEGYLSDADVAKSEGMIAWSLLSASLMDASFSYKSAPPRIQ